MRLPLHVVAALAREYEGLLLEQGYRIPRTWESPAGRGGRPAGLSEEARMPPLDNIASPCLSGTGIGGGTFGTGS